MNRDLDDVVGSPSRGPGDNVYNQEDLIDKKMAETRQAQQEIFKEMESQQEITKKIHDDIKKYKQAIKDQEKAKREYQAQQD